MLVNDRGEVGRAQNQILHRGSRLLFRYWETLRAERPCPTRQDINLRSLVPILPNLVVIEPNILAESGWRYRLVGTQVCELQQENPTKTDALAGWDKFEANVIINSFTLAAERFQPCLIRMSYNYGNKSIFTVEHMSVPVWESRTNTVQLLGGLFPLQETAPKHHSGQFKRELLSARMIWTEHQTGDALLEQTGRIAPIQLRIIQGGLK